MKIETISQLQAELEKWRDGSLGNAEDAKDSHRQLDEQRLKILNLEAKVAEMRAVIEARKPFEGGWARDSINHALSGDCGKGWKSPEQVKEMRDALEHIARYPIHSEPMGGAMDMQDIATKALEKLVEEK